MRGWRRRLNGMGADGWKAVAAAAEKGCRELETLDGLAWKVLYVVMLCT